MLTVFKRSVARSPEELTSPHSHADVRKNGMDLLDSFVSTNSGAVFLKLGDAGAMAYTHNKQALLKPRQIIFPCFCGLFLVLDDIFCVFEGSLENIAVLRQQYGLNKSANEVTIIIEAFRTLRDRGPYPADQVVRDLSGKFAFVLFDATSRTIFTAVGNNYPQLGLNAVEYTTTINYWLQMGILLAEACVECNAGLWRVTRLNLRNLSLEGAIASQIGNLSFLQFLDLAFNRRFAGHIPASLGLLGRLQQLHLERNLLEGPIPITLGDCRSLTGLHLSKNKLNGSIPHQLGNLRSLQVLGSWGNHLTGIIAQELGNCSMLQTIDLSENNISGRIPLQLGRITRLQQLIIHENRLAGEIPNSLLNCTQMRNLSLVDNVLYGPIPTEIGVWLTRLEWLLLSKNWLNGSIPESLGNCSSLSHLELAWNELSGIIPPQLGNLRHLTDINLFDNHLVSGSTATIPILDALSNCSNLKKLDLTNNFLTRTLSSSLGQLSAQLSYLSSEGNKIQGRIPREIGNLNGLTEFYLSKNHLVGSIPPTIGNLSNLHVLRLSVNKLEGSIPINGLKGLEYLYLYENILSGEIPKNFGKFQMLRWLDLSINNFSGAIPKEIGSYVNLKLLDLSYNNLSGTIPLEVASLRNFQLYFNLSDNGLTGHLPAQLRGMQMVQAINLSANTLSSSISNEISNCVELSYLNLSNNELAGMFPTSIGRELKSLEVIDLSFNKLSGRLPSSLSRLTMIRQLNLSYNNLEGPVPSSKSFRNIFIFRKSQTCGEWLGLEKCPYSRYSHSNAGSINKYVILVVSAIAMFVVFFSYIGFGLWLYRCHGNTEEGRHCFKLAPSLTMGYFSRISRQELSRATENFSSRNLLSAGSYGSVYRGILRGGEMVTIKVFTGLNDMSFLRECKTLGQVRHRNLVKILSSCSTLDLKALVLQFMPNGSLDKHLHSNDEHSYSNRQEAQRLSLKIRARILCELASAISYLHHDCSPSILHCDLKPENVLLDESMTAYVADFGIAHLGLNENGEQVETITSTLKGSVGYIAPEHGSGGRISSKGDVYSFGVLLLEMITQKRPTDEMFADGLTLTKWVSEAFPCRLHDVIDGGLLEEINSRSDAHTIEDSTLSIVQVGLSCTCDAPEKRPTMRQEAGWSGKLGSGRGEGGLGGTAHGKKYAPMANLPWGRTSLIPKLGDSALFKSRANEREGMIGNGTMGMDNVRLGDRTERCGME
eukprot:Gb_00728 [translate_table: standard]